MNSNNIILENGTVLFVDNIEDFNWKIGKIHEINIETHTDRSGWKALKVRIHRKILDVKERLNETMDVI